MLLQSGSSVSGSTAMFFALSLGVVVLIAGVLITWLALHYRSRNLRLKTIQQALQSQGLDAETKRMLGDALTANSRRLDAIFAWFGQALRSWGRTAFFVVGWMTFVIAGLCLVAMLVMGNGRTVEIQAAVFMTAVGFGLVSLPVAIGELRRGQPGAERR